MPPNQDEFCSKLEKGAPDLRDFSCTPKGVPGRFGGAKDISNKFRSRFGPGAAHKRAKTPQKRLHFVYFSSGQTFSRYHGRDQPVKRKATSSRLEPANRGMVGVEADQNERSFAQNSKIEL